MTTKERVKKFNEKYPVGTKVLFQCKGTEFVDVISKKAIAIESMYLNAGLIEFKNRTGRYDMDDVKKEVV